jgi:hypothetical protein
MADIVLTAAVYRPVGIPEGTALFAGQQEAYYWKD